MRLTLTPLPGRYAVCRLPARARLRPWMLGGGLCSVTRTRAELSVVCEARRVPPGVRTEAEWRALEIAGPLDFALIGILRAVLDPLAEAGLAVLALSTFDTDYVLVKAERLTQAARAWGRAGHTVRRPRRAPAAARDRSR